MRTEYPTARKSNRWWLYLLWFLYDLSISNGFILMNESKNNKLFTKTGKNKQRTMLNFRMNLAKQLVGNDIVRGKRNLEKTAEHWSRKEGKRRRCLNCKFFKNDKRTDSNIVCAGCPAFTKKGSYFSQTNLCLDCFQEYHKKISSIP